MRTHKQTACNSRAVIAAYTFQCTACEKVEHRRTPALPEGWAIEHIGEDIYAYCPDDAIDLPKGSDPVSAPFTPAECRALEAEWNGPDAPRARLCDRERRYWAAVHVLDRCAMPVLLHLIAAGIVTVIALQAVKGAGA